MKRLAALLVLFSLAAPTAAAPECQPSRWGPDDEIGSANLVTPASVLAASKLIRTGKTYPLGITIDSSTPAYPPRSMSLYIVQPGQQQGRQALPNSTYNDDMFVGWLGIGSQLDGLGHIGGPDGVYYNCNHARDFAELTGLKRLGIHNVPPIVARGVVLDMAGHRGVAHLEAGEAFTVEEVKAVEKRQGTPIREGDVVLFHTGWTDAKLGSDPAAWAAGAPGQSVEVARYLAGKNVVAVGADTSVVDAVPSAEPDEPFPGHLVLLKEHGIYILETMNTGPLVRDGAYEFMFVLGQARVRGAVQMIINPVAIR